MKLFIFIPYIVGALIGTLCSFTSEPVASLVFLVLFPYAVLWLLEVTGLFYFQTIRQEPDRRFEIMDEIVRKNLTEKQAAEKYGWAAVQEMDLGLTEMQADLNHVRDLLETNQKKRDEFAKLLTGK
jgi:hypothetical protein